MTIDEFSKQLIERAIVQLDEKSTCNHTGAGKSSKQNRKEELMPDELVGTTYEVVMEDGETIIIEKEKGLDGKACWKGYKLAGTKKKGGKTVDNCVKAGYEMDGEQELDEKNGLYANIHAKRRRGESPAKPGHEDYPAKDAFKKAAKTAKKEEVEYVDEKRDMPGNQEKIDANKNGKVDAHDFALLRAKKTKKSVREMWEKAAEVQEAYGCGGKAKKKAVAEGKKVEIEVMPEVETQNDPDPPTGKKAKKEVKKEEFEPLEEKKLSKAETVKKEKFVKGMKKKFGSFKSKYGEKAQSVMYGTATTMAKKTAK